MLEEERIMKNFKDKQVKKSLRGSELSLLDGNMEFENLVQECDNYIHKQTHFLESSLLKSDLKNKERLVVDDFEIEIEIENDNEEEEKDTVELLCGE